MDVDERTPSKLAADDVKNRSVHPNDKSDDFENPSLGLNGIFIIHIDRM